MDRKDIKNVPRLDDKARKDLENVGRPTSDKSILARQSEIKKKIIDEQESAKMSEQKKLATYLGISDSVIETVRKIITDSKCDTENEKEEKNDKKENSKSKTKVDVNPKTKNPEMNEALSPKQKKHLDKNKNNRIDADDFKILRKEEVEELDELTGKGNLRSMMKQYTRERDAAVKDKDMEKAKDLDKKVTRATRMFGHNAALKAAREVFPNVKRKDPFYGPKYKKSDVKESDDSVALSKVNKIAADLKDMSKQPIKPIKKDPNKLPHVNDGAPEMFKIKNESLIESIKKMIREPKNLAANPNDAVKGVKSADAGRTHVTD